MNARHKEPNSIPSIERFFGNYSYEQPEGNRQLKAAFFSISGYTGQAHSWYKDMAADKKKSFEIYDLEKIESLLVEGKLLLQEKEFDSTIRKNTNLPFGERYLLFFKSHLYLIQLINVAGKPERFLILTATGEIPNRSIIADILKSDSNIKVASPNRLCNYG